MHVVAGAERFGLIAACLGVVGKRMEIETEVTAEVYAFLAGTLEDCLLGGPCHGGFPGRRADEALFFRREHAVFNAVYALVDDFHIDTDALRRRPCGNHPRQCDRLKPISMRAPAFST